MIKSIIAVSFGAVLGGAVVLWFCIKQSMEITQVFESAESSRAESRAMEAYQHEEPSIAIWELRHLADTEAKELRQGGVFTNESRAGLVMTRARLAKLYREVGRVSEAETNAQIAISLLSGFPNSTNTILTNLESLLEHVEEIDSRTKKERRYE